MDREKHIETDKEMDRERDIDTMDTITDKE